MFGAVIREGGWPAKAQGDACMEGGLASRRGQLFAGAPTETWGSQGYSFAWTEAMETGLGCGYPSCGLYVSSPGH